MLLGLPKLNIYVALKLLWKSDFFSTNCIEAQIPKKKIVQSMQLWVASTLKLKAKILIYVANLLKKLSNE